MSWFKLKKLSLNSYNEHLKELSRDSSSTYYYRHRTEILEKRRKRYRETGY